MPMNSLRVFSAMALIAVTALYAAEKPKTAAAPAASDPYAEVQPASETLDLNMYQRIRDEGLNHSHVMEFASALMDGIGPRLTGSPNAKKSQRVDARHAYQDWARKCSPGRLGRLRLWLATTEFVGAYGYA